MDVNMDAATATRLAADPRMIATPWQVNGVPSFPAYYATRPPARGPFIRRQAAVALWQYILLDLVYYGFLSWTGQKAFPLRAGQLEAQHLPPGPWVASGLSMLAIALIGRLSFDIPYRVASIVVVAGGVSTANFPPLFGSIWEAYSLKNFWGWVYFSFFCLVDCYSGLIPIGNVGINSCVNRLRLPAMPSPTRYCVFLARQWWEDTLISPLFSDFPASRTILARGQLTSRTPGQCTFSAYLVWVS